MAKDLYTLLEISKTASAEEIKKAYKKLAMKYHPDRNKDNPKSEETFKEIKEAYEILSDNNRRNQYDTFGSTSNQQSSQQGFDNFADFGDVFADLFNQHNNRRNSNTKGDDLEINQTISFREACLGAKININIPSHHACAECNSTGARKGTDIDTCQTCNGHGEVNVKQGFFTTLMKCPKCVGSGKIIKHKCEKCHGNGHTTKNINTEVDIPGGVEENMALRLAGKGGISKNGGRQGDLFIHIKIKEDEFFTREGLNLHCIVPTSFTTVAMGGEVLVPSLEGNIKLEVPEGTQSGSILKIRNKGAKSLKNNSQGDIFYHISVETPKNLTTKQKEILKEFETSINTKSTWFEKVTKAFK